MRGKTCLLLPNPPDLPATTAMAFRMALALYPLLHVESEIAASAFFRSAPLLRRMVLNAHHYSTRGERAYPTLVVS